LFLLKFCLWPAFTAFSWPPPWLSHFSYFQQGRTILGFASFFIVGRKIAMQISSLRGKAVAESSTE